MYTTKNFKTKVDFKTKVELIRAVNQYLRYTIALETAAKAGDPDR